MQMKEIRDVGWRCGMARQVLFRTTIGHMQSCTGRPARPSGLHGSEGVWSRIPLRSPAERGRLSEVGSPERRVGGGVPRRPPGKLMESDGSSAPSDSLRGETPDRDPVAGPAPRERGMARPSFSARGAGRTPDRRSGARRQRAASFRGAARLRLRRSGSLSRERDTPLSPAGDDPAGPSLGGQCAPRGPDAA